MEKKEKDNNQQLYGYLSQQNEDQGPANEYQSFEAHETYPYEYSYNFSQQYHQYQQNQYEDYNMLPQSLSSYGITYSPTPQSSSGITDSLNPPGISTDNTLSDMSYATNNHNCDQLDVFYANSSKETQQDSPFSSEMFKKSFTSDNAGSSITTTSTSFQNELDARNTFENGHYYFDPNLSFYNEKHTSNALSISNSNNGQHLASGVDTPTQKSNVRKEGDVFNELLSLAANKNQSPYLTIQQQSEIPGEKVKDVHKKTQKTPPTSSNYRNKYKDYSETSSSSALDYLDLVYNLVMVQQPSRARMCGFGDKDRRPISPPPIAKLIVTSKNGEPVSSDTFDISFLVAMCDTWKCGDASNTDANVVKHHGSLSQVITFSNDNESTTVNMKNLVGSAAVSATKLYDLEGKLGIFFVFHDISLRTEGCFRLRITLIDIGSPYRRTVNTASTSKTITSVYTDPFVVYTAKKFPGVTDSTPISKCFARQGVKISIRKDSSKNDVKSKEYEKKNTE